MKRTVLLATSTFGEFDPAPVDRLRSAGFDCVRNPHGRSLTTEELVALMGDAVAVVAGTESYARAVLERLPRLRVLSRCGAGTDNVDLAAATERGVRVFSTPSAPAPAVAELTLGLILALLRQIPQSDAEVRSGRFSKKMGFLVSEKVYGIVGLGRVGRRVASLLRNLGATVLGNDSNRSRSGMGESGRCPIGRPFRRVHGGRRRVAPRAVRPVPAAFGGGGHVGVDAEGLLRDQCLARRVGGRGRLGRRVANRPVGRRRAGCVRAGTLPGTVERAFRAWC